MVEFTKELATRVASERIGRGHQLRENAAYGGSMHDGGGGALIGEATAFIAGLNQQWPAGWEREAEVLLKLMELEADPEYATFQRLKAKFGER